MNDILVSFAQYFGIGIVLVLIAICGIFIGKVLRNKKDLKNQQETE